MPVVPAERRVSLVSEIDDAFDTMQVATARLLRSIAAFDAEKLWERDGALRMADWLADRYRVTAKTANEWVLLARALQGLPFIARAYEERSLTWDQLRVLGRVATPETDEAWAVRGETMTPAALWREWQQQRVRRRRDAVEDHGMRRVWMGWDEDRRFFELHGEFAAEQGAAIEAGIRARAKDVALEDGVLMDPEGARLADALEAAVCSGDGAAPGTLVLHADAEVVAGAPATGRKRLAETEDGVRVAQDAVRRMACDARVEWVLARDGVTVGVGRRGRQVPGAVARALRFRDRGCRFPGCTSRRWVQAHHIVHWARGGPTDLSNLVLLCSGHHRRLHEGGWRITGHPDRELHFIDQTGRRLGARHGGAGPG